MEFQSLAGALASVFVLAQSPSAQLPAGHPPVKDGKSARSADEILKQLDGMPNLKDRVKTFEIASSIGRLYYASSRFSEAATFLGTAEKLAEPARALFLQERKKLGTREVPVLDASQCGVGSNPTLEKQVEAARKKLTAKDAAGAAGCLRLALEPSIEVLRMRGNALFLTGDGKGALAEYERCLEAASDQRGCLFGHAAVLFDTQGDSIPALRKAKLEWEKYLRLNPSDARQEEVTKLVERTDQAIAAGGLGALAKKRTAQTRMKVAANSVPPRSAAEGGGGGPKELPPITPEMMQAIQNTERTPELAQGLAKLVEEGEEHLARGRYQEALDAYKRVVPFQPDNGRAKAGMAWALVGLNRQPMADRVWSVAVSADPAAVDKLGDTLTSKGDLRGAQALWSKLASADPSYAERASLKKKLK